MRVGQMLGAAVVVCSGGGLPPASVAAKAPTAATAAAIQKASSYNGEGARWWQAGGGGEAKESWLSSVAHKIKQHTPSVGGSQAKVAWTAYESRKSELTRNPDDARLQLETAEALLKWMRHSTNGNFPRVSEEGRVSQGDSPASRAIWRKYAPEALRLLKDGATHALGSSDNSGGFDVAKYRFLQAEASTYLSSAKGILRAALQADAVAFKRNVKPLIDDHPAYQGGVGHTFMGSFYLVAPWPVHNLAKAKAHFDAALKIDSRCPRNHYCRGLVALELGNVQEARSSFRRALMCKPTSPEEGDVGDFFHAESRGALTVLDRSGGDMGGKRIAAEQGKGRGRRRGNGKRKELAVDGSPEDSSAAPAAFVKSKLATDW